MLSDVDQSGTRVITTPHVRGPLAVRSFPGLDPLWEIDPPDDEHGWDFTACFAGDIVIGRLIGLNERLVAIGPDDMIRELGHEGDWLIPSADDSWLTATGTELRRMRMA